MSGAVVLDIGIFVGLLISLLVALELGYRRGRRLTKESDAQIGAIQGALLGLLGLLLAFSFSAAGARFLERQDLIVQEANAIGTAYLRADLLAEPFRTTLRGELKRYTEHRIAAVAHLHASRWEPSVLAEVDAMQGEIWKTATAGVAERPDLAKAVLDPINEVFDLHSTRIAAAHKHIPALVLGLLLVCSLLSIAVLGYGCGMARDRRALMTVPLALIIGVSLWITLDLDQPRTGLLQLNDEPLKALHFDSQ